MQHAHTTRPDRHVLRNALLCSYRLYLFTGTVTFAAKSFMKRVKASQILGEAVRA
jgi:hypothetical protein